MNEMQLKDVNGFWEQPFQKMADAQQILQMGLQQWPQLWPGFNKAAPSGLLQSLDCTSLTAAILLYKLKT